MSMIKIDIIQRVSDKLGMSKNNSAQLVESVFTIMKEQLSKGGIQNIGVWQFRCEM